jgi:hypothetical protein
MTPIRSWPLNRPRPGKASPGEILMARTPTARPHQLVPRTRATARHANRQPRIRSRRLVDLESLAAAATLADVLWRLTWWWLGK